MRCAKQVFVAVLAVIVLGAASCSCDADLKCRDASRDATYSEDYETMKQAMQYFRENCTWDGGQPVAK